MAKTFQDLVSSHSLVLIDFSAEWCGPCKMLAPILEQLNIAVGDDVRIFKIDVDKNNHLAMHYEVQSVPTLMLFKDGELAWRESGMKTLPQLKKIVATHKAEVSEKL
jgi:thioredoxin 1